MSVSRDSASCFSDAGVIRGTILCSMSMEGWMWLAHTRKYKMKVVKSLDGPREIAAIINNALVRSTSP